MAARPEERNGLGFTDEEMVREAAKIEALFDFLPDSAAIHPEWKRIVTQHRVRGLKTFDARLVAFMVIYGIGQILTFNSGDFVRYPEIAVVDPSDIAASGYPKA